MATMTDKFESRPPVPAIVKRPLYRQSLNKLSPHQADSAAEQQVAVPGGVTRTAGGEQEPENKKMRTDKPVSEAPGRAASEPPLADAVGPASSEP